MARPKKDKDLLMDHYLRVMLTADQDAAIRQAAKTAGIDVSAWVRAVLLEAAQEQASRTEKMAKRGSHAKPGRV